MGMTPVGAPDFTPLAVPVPSHTGSLGVGPVSRGRDEAGELGVGDLEAIDREGRDRDSMHRALRALSALRAHSQDSTRDRHDRILRGDGARANEQRHAEDRRQRAES